MSTVSRFAAIPAKGGGTVIPLYFFILCVALSMLLAYKRAPLVVVCVPVVTFGVVALWKGSRR